MLSSGRVLPLMRDDEKGEWATRPARKQGRIVPVWLWAGAAAALLLFSFFNVRQMRQLQGELAELSRAAELQRRRAAELEKERREYEQILAILAAPEARLVRLKGTPGNLPELRAYWSEGQGIVMTGRRLPSLAADRAYQLWIVLKKGSSTSAGVFRPGPAGEITHLAVATTGMAQAAALAVTEEPAGGSSQPTSTPIWVGPIT